MTKPCYPVVACAAGSEVSGVASSSSYAANSENAWYVSFSSGYAYCGRRYDAGLARAVRGASPREYQGVTLQELHAAWIAARKSKAPSFNRLTFDDRWIDRLLELQERLNAGTWSPAPCVCFIAQRPKAREIHAPDFGDRVVHHWLVPQLEQLYERRFIHDSFSNRTGKGTHAAVDRLRTFVRQVHSGQGGGYFLQLDVRTFFNSIHRPTLYAMLKRTMEEAGTPEVVRRATHALLRRSPLAQGVRHRSTVSERAKVPPHKRLENAAPGCGLPIGNLSSQFFANVYMDSLDQFVKHELKVPRYVRYVDDFVLVHHDREQLVEWQQRIETFLRDRLRLELKPDRKLQPLSSGIDFLGYIVYPTHTRTRRRVLSHAHEAFSGWGRTHVHGSRIRATPAEFREVRSIWSSYEGHLRHANAWRARQDLVERFPWLRPLVTGELRFDYRLESRVVEMPSNGR